MNSIQCLARAMTPKRPATQVGVGEATRNSAILIKNESLSARNLLRSTFKRSNSTQPGHTVVYREISGLRCYASEKVVHPDVKIYPEQE